MACANRKTVPDTFFSSEMLSHAWLTEDHAVQRTQFANGVEVTVNFGKTPYQLEDGTMLESLANYVVE